MTIAVVGATGRVGSLVVQRLVEASEAVRVLVRDAGKARRLFGDGNVEVREVRLDDRGEVADALDGADVVFIAMGSAGTEGNLQRVVLDAAAQSSDLRQVVRLSVLNAGPSSLGINQRGHWDIDFAAEVLGLPYTTIRPAIFSASVLAGAAEIRQNRAWTGLADSGRVALCDHADVADVAVRVLRDPTTWDTHHDLTGPRPVSWVDVMGMLSAELGEELLRRLVDAGVPPFQAELLIAREWAILAGENDRTTDTISKLLGRPPRTIEAYLHEQVDLFR
jgi:uncharacterized protein YbjT (DUF2867 family)